MTMRAENCSNCRWFKPVEDGQFMSGGWCDWRAPVMMRHMLWGAHNERIPKPEAEWCAEHASGEEQKR